jgi:hypothetical protein
VDIEQTHREEEQHPVQGLGSKFFAKWVRVAFIQMNEAQNVAMTVDQHRVFWSNRITLAMAQELFKALFSRLRSLPLPSPSLLDIQATGHSDTLSDGSD